ncbi:MAG: GNAT family N-acetyltransferase [Lachnospiraceae bacterium]|nr:GNAT family N-acetyltransferase [Lachnospiraceae bacterium]
MNFVYETEHLYMQTLIESDAPILLDFCRRNADFFAPFEPKQPERFLTEEYQRLMINGFSQQFLRLQAARYYLFEKNRDDRIVGCVGLSEIHTGNDRCAKILYKVDRLFCGRGYAVEASQKLISEAVSSLNLHRIEADILLSNEPSKRVAEKLGFEYEGIARSSHKINGKWEDHARYALICD